MSQRKYNTNEANAQSNLHRTTNKIDHAIFMLPYPEMAKFDYSFQISVCIL